MLLHALELAVSVQHCLLLSNFVTAAHMHCLASEDYLTVILSIVPVSHVLCGYYPQ